MDNKYLEILEYDKILSGVAACCKSASAQNAVLSQQPLKDQDEIERELSRTREAYIILYEYCDNPVSGFDSVLESLLKIQKGGVLEIKQLLRISALLFQTEKLKDALHKYDDDRIAELPRIASLIDGAHELAEKLQRAIASDDELSDEASVKLADLRALIRQTQNRIKDKLRHYVTGTQYAAVLQDRIVTMRDGRYVLPVRAECKSSVNGIVHDTSDSGATCYIEPMAIIELNNKLREAESAEQEEISRILAELSREVALKADIVENNEYYHTLFDVIFARAAFAERTNSVCPQIGSDRRLFFKGARHPLLNPKTVVPTTLEIGADKRILIISGPNTGGKTVVLKTIGLLCAMTYSGLFLPCEESVVPFFDAIFCDIGDNQSIAESLSTFSSHIKNIIRILEQSTENSLVLLDELGAGTDPTEGAALAVVVTGAFDSRRVTAVITTHYSEMKEYGLMTPTVENASMEFDPVTLQPTYRLKMGLPGVSNALGIAAMLGLDRKILDAARKYVGEGKRTFESVLALADAARTEAYDEREALEAERKELRRDLDALNAERDAVEKQYEKLTQAAHAEVEKMIGKYVEQAQNIIESMTELEKDVNSGSLLKAKQLRTSLSAIEKPLPREEKFEPISKDSIKIGDEVVMKTLGSAAKIKTLPDRQGKLDVAIGNLIVKTRVEELARRLYAKPVETKKRSSPIKHTAAARGAAMTEINLLGKTVDEAIPLVDALIDGALMHGVLQVKIIHGNGTGALRKGILSHLKSHRRVAEYRQGGYGEGGYGVTIVTVK